ncbi:MAG: hypothetical protein ACK4YQ_06885 [Phenylobacterium sp.]|uniref:hypothetical protein n=1 Tax=Phenylobacterium sp. TaxID=1871053 RepID=UPI003919842D
MRALILFTCGLTLAATGAQACASCGEADYAAASAYIDYRGMTPEQQRAADAAAAAEAREADMNKARLAFISRFSIAVDAPPAQTAQAEPDSAPAEPAAQTAELQ